MHRIRPSTDDVASYHNNTILEGQYRGLLATTNCSDLVCLRSLDTEVLKVAQQQTYVNAYYTVPDGLYGYGDFYYGPSVSQFRLDPKRNPFLTYIFCPGGWRRHSRSP